MIVRIPIPEAWVDGKRYAIEFDTEKIKNIETNRDVASDGMGGKILAGPNRLSLYFETLDDEPKWVEI
jgi:hypothetical protein